MRKLTQDVDTIESIIQQATVCRIGLCDDGQPYVVPVSFGYEDSTLYIHSGTKGRKLDILRKNDAVCVEFDVDHQIIEAENPCKWNVGYRSVIGFGRASLVEDPEERRKALDLVVTHYGGEPIDYPDDTLARTAIIRVDIQEMTGKIAEYE